TAHDPYSLADKLRGVSLYMSAGSGTEGSFDKPSDVPGFSTNLTGTGLEILSRLTTQNLAAKLNKLTIAAPAEFRASGTHSWPYWDFEMRSSWPQAASALGVDVSGPDCKAGGAIAPVALAAKWLGDCVTGEYPVAGGIAQDFHGGRVFWSAPAG